MRGFPCWGQFVAMLFCQLGQAHSLRESCGGLAATEGRLKHLSLDASIIDLCLSLYDWARFRRTKGAVKLHLLLDRDGYPPSFAVLTEGKTHDLQVARKLAFDPGTVVVFDRGYADYEWFAELGRRGVFFVTRLKRKADFEVVESRPVPQRSRILSDEVICFPSRSQPSPEYFFRRIVMHDPERDEPLVFLTNHLDFGATTVAAIYKDRWQVKLFFKALKQNLRVKTFVGVSANAVRTQLFTALIAMLVLRYLQLRARYGWSLSNLAALLKQQLFVYRDVWAWLDAPFELPLAGR